MLKKLRNKLLIFQMSIISIVILSSFILIYISMHTNIKNSNFDKMNKLQNMQFTVSFYNPDGINTVETYNQATAQLEIDPINPEYSTYFTLSLDQSGNLNGIFPFLDFPFEVYADAIQKTSQSESKNHFQNTGEIDFANEKWLYQIISNTSVSIDQQLPHANMLDKTLIETSSIDIFFLNITDSAKTLSQLRLTFISISIILLLVIFFISTKFSNISIIPIEESWNKQKQFVADASHELKTPLAILSANLDVISLNPDNNIKSQEKWINNMQDQISMMNGLVSDLLYLAREENMNNTTNSFVPFDISMLTDNICTSIETIAYEKNISFNTNIEENIFVKADEEKISQVIKNLIDNAIKYTPENQEINIYLSLNKNNVEFKITNTGVNIPAENIKNIFDRFYQVDQSRTNKGGGYGLGLSIAKTIVENSGGKIFAESDNNSVTFRFTLKKHK